MVVLCFAWDETSCRSKAGRTMTRARAAWWIAALLIFATVEVGAAEQQARRIYLFEGLAPWQPGGAASLEAFRQRLKEKSSINHELHLDYLDLGRFPGRAHEERLVRFLGEKFTQNPPHLLVP